MSESSGPTRRPYAAANEFEGGGTQALIESPEQRALAPIDPYNIFVLGHEHKQWRAKNPPPEEQDFRFAIVSATSVTVKSDFYCDFQIEKFLPGMVTDTDSKKIVPLRRRILKKSADGQVIFPVCFIPAVKFLAEYEPEETWMSATEFENILEELKPVIEHDLALLKTEKAFHQEQNRRNAEAEAARASLGQALQQLGFAAKHA